MLEVVDVRNALKYLLEFGDMLWQTLTAVYIHK